MNKVNCETQIKINFQHKNATTNEYNLLPLSLYIYIKILYGIALLQSDVNIIIFHAEASSSFTSTQNSILYENMGRKKNENIQYQSE